jgi:hypothetical protein
MTIIRLKGKQNVLGLAPFHALSKKPGQPLSAISFRFCVLSPHFVTIFARITISPYFGNYSENYFCVIEIADILRFQGINYY